MAIIPFYWTISPIFSNFQNNTLRRTLCGVNPEILPMTAHSHPTHPSVGDLATRWAATANHVPPGARNGPALAHRNRAMAATATSRSTLKSAEALS